MNKIAGRPPLNKPTVSVKIYSDTVKRLKEIKKQSGKAIVQIIEEAFPTNKNEV